MSITRVSDDYSAAPQITAADVAEIKALGFRSIMCNRPDGEAPGQPTSADIAAEAERLGLGFAYVPVLPGGITPEDVAGFRAAIASLPAPVLSYCRSGTRSQNIWALARR